MAELQREYNGAADPIDFSDGLGESFGVEDTTVIGKNQLDSFLFNEPTTQVEDTNSIQRVEDQPPTEPQSTQKSQDKSKIKSQLTEEESQEEVEKANSSLKDWLSSSKDKEDVNEDTSKVEDKSQTSEEVPTEQDNENQYVTLSKDLYKLGVFTTDEGEEQIIANTPEEFLERFQQEKQRGATEMVSNFLERFGENYKEMFDAVFVKGVDPKDYLASYTRIESVKGLDLNTESNQEKVFTQYYRSQGLSEERIQKRLEKAKDYGDLADEAVELHELLIQKEEKELARIEADKQQELAMKQQRELSYQQNVNKILQNKMTGGDFDGIPVNKKEAQDTFYYMTHKPYKLPNGELITEMQKDWLELDRPENHELKVKMALLMKNKMDLSKVQKKAVSSKSDSLFTTITNKKTASTRKEGTVTAPKSFFS